MSNTGRNKLNKIVRSELAGGHEVLDTLEAWHVRLNHFKKEGNDVAAKIAQETLNDLNEIAQAMRDEADKRRKSNLD